MNNLLTIAYMTNRMDCRIQWFYESLLKQLNDINPSNPIELIVVDFYADTRELEPPKELSEKLRRFAHTEPKPTVWQGKSRLTSKNYFAASNARNTAIINCNDGHIAYIDDLTVLGENWLKRVFVCVNSPVEYFACGTYEKVKGIEVENGELKNFERIPQGLDGRYKYLIEQYGEHESIPELVACSGQWFFGCSLCGPLKGFIKVNGWDEDCDSMAGEDYACGFMIGNAGYQIMFDKEMKTFEDHDLHYVEEPFVRIDKADVMGCKDASHAYLRFIERGRPMAPNYFGDGGIDAERKKVLSGGSYTITQVPDKDWRDGKLLREM